MNSQILPMTLGDIFERSFTLIGKTFVRNLVVAAIFLVLPVVLLTIAADNFYSTIADMNFDPHWAIEHPGFDVIAPFIGQLAFFFVAIFVLSISLLLAEVTASYIVGKEMMGEPVSFNKALEETFNVKWLYAIGQGLLKFLIIGGGVAILAFFLSTFAIVIDSGAVLGILIGIIMIVAVPAIIYTVLRWYFSATAVAVEDLSPVDSLRQSWFLVKGYWWRTLGILMLLSILSQFAISIVTLPIRFGSMWGVYREVFTAIGQTSGNLDPQSIHQIQKAMGPGIGIGTGITSLFSLLITPVFTVVMYFDLRARKNDLPGMSSPEPTEPEGKDLPPEIIEPTSGGGSF